MDGWMGSSPRAVAHRRRAHISTPRPLQVKVRSPLVDRLRRDQRPAADFNYNGPVPSTHVREVDGRLLLSTGSSSGYFQLALGRSLQRIQPLGKQERRGGRRKERKGKKEIRELGKPAMHHSLRDSALATHRQPAHLQRCSTCRLDEHPVVAQKPNVRPHHVLILEHEREDPKPPFLVYAP